MSKLYREFYDVVLDDTKRHDAIQEALNMGYESHQELVDNYEKCHVKHKGCATHNAKMEVDILVADYDLDQYRYGV